MKIDFRRNFDILRFLNFKSKKCFLTLNIDFQEIMVFAENVIFTTYVLISKFQEFCETV